MIAARESLPRFTPEEYFEWEERQEIRHEYFDGEVSAMTGGTLNHSEIATNFGASLKAHLRGGKCRLLNSDARINIIYTKDNGGKWDILNYRSGDLVELVSIDLTFSIEQIYEDIVFEVEE